jgi:hypothetical protein
MILRPELPYQKLKRTVHIARHKTSISLELAFWSALKEIAALEGVPASTLVNCIDTRTASTKIYLQPSVLTFWNIIAGWRSRKQSVERASSLKKTVSQCRPASDEPHHRGRISIETQGVAGLRWRPSVRIRKAPMSNDDGKPTSDDSLKAPIKLNVTDSTPHKVERMVDGRFMAYWNRRVVYENGRIKRFATSEEALAFLKRCDAAGRIIH